jgi:hypothetical protein
MGELEGDGDCKLGVRANAPDDYAKTPRWREPEIPSSSSTFPDLCIPIRISTCCVPKSSA